MAAQAQRSATNAAALQRQNVANATMMRGRGRPQNITKAQPGGAVMRNNIQPQHLNRNLPGLSMQNTSYQLNAAGQFIQVSSNIAQNHSKRNLTVYKFYILGARTEIVQNATT